MDHDFDTRLGRAVLLAATLLLAPIPAQFGLPELALEADAAGWQVRGTVSGGPYAVCGVLRLTRDAPWPAGTTVEEVPVAETLDVLPGAPPEPREVSFGEGWSAPPGPGTWYVDVSLLWFLGPACYAGIPLGLGALDVSFVVTSTTSPRGPGFWRRHLEAWPTASMLLGPSFLMQNDLLLLLSEPVRGDATLALARQLVAAYLNVAAGCDPEIQPVIDDALLLLQAAPPGSRPCGSLRRDALALKDALERYNT